MLIKACTWTEVSVQDWFGCSRNMNFIWSFMALFTSSGLTETSSLHESLACVVQFILTASMHNDYIPSGQQKIDCVRNCDHYKSNHPLSYKLSYGYKNTTVDSGDSWILVPILSLISYGVVGKRQLKCTRDENN